MPIPAAPLSGSFLRTQLGSPTPAEYEAVLAEKEALSAQVAELQAQLEEAQGKARPCPSLPRAVLAWGHVLRTSPPALAAKPLRLARADGPSPHRS